MKVTRRAFIGSTATLAVGAAAGIAAFKGFRRHGPIELRTYLFSKDPIVIQGDLSSDERRDVFRVHVKDDRGKEMCVAEMSLSGVRKAVDSWSGRGKVICLCIEEKRTFPLPLAIVVEDGQVTFLVEEPGREPAPFWMRLVDVRRVL